ncbi:L,D-transpeptidase family protein [Croceicoccus ponticola]|nr:L,D-transpeptidase family protein [Croceicoccus ponticola]
MSGLLAASPAMAARWTSDDLVTLRQWVAAAPNEGLPELPVRPLSRAVAAGAEAQIDEAADALALELARMHLLGAATSGERAGWNIVDPDRDIDLAPMLDHAVGNGSLGSFLAGLRPVHPDYAILRRALATETDLDRRTAIVRNMERWRWMPRDPGADYLIVNAPAFEARLWRGGKPVGAWRVIVGKTSTPTPIFGATVTGVNINPWWYIPASIVRESIGALVRRSPATARARGYVWGNGSYRQRPGPNNALGVVKLVMPNNYRVYLHDTPNKALFDEQVRTFSHGCIRVSDALGLATTLLDGRMTRDEIDAIVATRKTTTVDLPRGLPIYVTYFTAFADGDGSVRVVPDIYRRDTRIRASADMRPPVRMAETTVGEGCPVPANAAG